MAEWQLGAARVAETGMSRENGVLEQTLENHISNEDVMKERSASDKAADPLPSWHEGPAKSAIVQFVQSVTEKGGKDYVPPEERISGPGASWVMASFTHLGRPSRVGP